MPAKNMKVNVKNLKEVREDLKVVQERLQILTRWIWYCQLTLKTVEGTEPPSVPVLGGGNPQPPPGP
jgi:hypothetical protein